MTRGLLVALAAAQALGGCEPAGGQVRPPRPDRPRPADGVTHLDGARDLLWTFPDQAPPLPKDLGPKDTGVFGNKTCREIDACLWDCGPKDTDQACWVGCAQKGTAPAQAAFKALDACWMTKTTVCASACTVPNAFSCWLCLYQSCPGEFQGCFNAPAGGTGSATCPQIFDCFSSCSGTDSLCLLKCIWSGTAAGQKQYVAIDVCQNQGMAGTCKTACANRQSTTCTNCLASLCSTPYAACK